ncbi:hypothetical protein LEP1GSC040_1881 [Leptospira santarosai str. 2000030832]|nr:hypothetical protein LEP1GSC040_1881 [Leptospira santarosai str. 2000030832]
MLNDIRFPTVFLRSIPKIVRASKILLNLRINPFAKFSKTYCAVFGSASLDRFLDQFQV